MTEATVADELAWTALPEEVRAQYRRAMYEELYAEIKNETEWEVECKAEDECENLRRVINEYRDALEAIVRSAEEALEDIS